MPVSDDAMSADAASSPNAVSGETVLRLPPGAIRTEGLA